MLGWIGCLHFLTFNTLLEGEMHPHDSQHTANMWWISWVSQMWLVCRIFQKVLCSECSLALSHADSFPIENVLAMFFRSVQLLVYHCKVNVMYNYTMAVCLRAGQPPPFPGLPLANICSWIQNGFRCFVSCFECSEIFWDILSLISHDSQEMQRKMQSLDSLESFCN